MKLALGQALLLATGAATAFTDSGSFNNFNQVVYVKFTAGSGSNLTLETEGWAGGGFDPLIVLYDSTGNEIAPLLGGAGISTGILNDDSQTSATIPVVDPIAGAPNIGLDSFWQENAFGIYGSLIPGDTYYVALAQAPNTPNSNAIAGLWSWDGLSSNPSYTNAFGDGTETGYWKLNITGNDGAATTMTRNEIRAQFGTVPELDAMSGTAALGLVAGFLALAGERRRRG